MYMDVRIIIDHRESVIKEMVGGGCLEECTFENLYIGDVVIKVKDTPLIVMERKTLSDLAASIKDGRYRNQKLKMLETYESSVVYYIIEGTFDFVETDVMLNGISKKAIISCVVNTMIRDNIKVFVTKNVKETFQLIQSIFLRVQKEPEKYLKTSDDPKVNVFVQKGKGTLSKEDCYRNQLCQIPDVSLKTASAIVKQYPSFKEMLAALSSLDDLEKLKLLKEIRTEDNNGKQRRISEKVAKNIIEYIL